MTTINSKSIKKPRPTNETKRYWRDLDVNIDLIISEWPNEIASLFSDIVSWEEQEIHKLGSLYDIKRKTTKAIISNLKSSNTISLELTCIKSFMNKNRKVTSRSIGIALVGSKINEPEVLLKLVNEQKNGTLRKVYLKRLSVRLGLGSYKYSLHKVPATKNITKLIDDSKSLAIALGRMDKKRRSYTVRYAEKLGNDLYILILKQTADKILPAIPHNKHVKSAKYILCKFDLGISKLAITTRSRIEAAVIKNYSGKKLSVPIAFKVGEHKGDAKKFFKKLLDTKGNHKAKLILNKVQLVESLGDLRFRIEGHHSPDEISKGLAVLKETGTIQLKDFSEFNSFSFRHLDITFHVNVKRDKWGNQWLELHTAGRPLKERESFKTSFQKRFDIEFERRLIGDVLSKNVAQTMLDKQKVEAIMPESVEEVFLDLIEKKVIKKPSQSVKRRCLNCNSISWEKGNCPGCGGDMLIIGDYLNIKFNFRGATSFLTSYLKKHTKKIPKKRIRTIGRMKHEFLVVENDEKEDIWFYLTTSGKVNDVAELFSYTGLPLIFMFLRHGKNRSAEMIEKGFPCFEMADVIFSDPWPALSSSMKELQENFSSKRKTAAKNSYDRLRKKPKSYCDQDFEQDVYNLIHEICKVGDRLGGKFSGVAAPDGIVCVSDMDTRKPKRFSMAWDCKFSTSRGGYKLRDKPEKHRKYLRTLRKDKNVKKFGGFRTYLIISQNMSSSYYRRFFTKLTTGFRGWRGNIMYMSEHSLLELFRLYRSYQNQIEQNPSIYYAEVYKLFYRTLKEAKDPYPHISESAMDSFVEEIKKGYRRKRIRFNLKRSDFV